MSFINPLRYFINGILKLEFEGYPIVIRNCEAYYPEAACPPRDSFLEGLGYDDTSIATCVWFLVGTYVAASVLFVGVYSKLGWKQLRRTPDTSNRGTDTDMNTPPAPQLLATYQAGATCAEPPTTPYTQSHEADHLHTVVVPTPAAAPPTHPPRIMILEQDSYMGVTML